MMLVCKFTVQFVSFMLSHSVRRCVCFFFLPCGDHWAKIAVVRQVCRQSASCSSAHICCSL